MEAHVAVKILAVDDSAVMRKIMEMTFAGEDAEVLTAASADEGIAAAQQFAPDVVFADASMAGKDGYAVASAVKSAGGKAPVVIVMASQHTPYDEAKGAASGVDDHVAKPFDSQAVIDKVSAAMSGAVARKPAPAPAGGPVQAASGTPARSLKRTMAFGSPPPRPPAPPAPPAPPKAQLEVVEEDEPVIELSAPPARAPSKKPPKAAPKKPAPAKAAPAAAPAASPAAAATAPDSALAGNLDALGLSKEQVESVLALSRDVVEKVVWEVVPDLAETLIREELKRLMK